MDTPETLHLQYAKRQDLRYGENPHQRAALYIRDDGVSGGIATADVLHGKPMSFLNYVDADAAWQAVWDIATPACVVVKHASPCGAATRTDLVDAYVLALGGDPLSAYGGIVVVNRPVDAELAAAVRDLRNPLTGQRQRWDVFVAPAFSEDGLAILRAKSKDLRVLRADPPSPRTVQIRPISGGVLVQEPDSFDEAEFRFDAVTDRPPTPAEVRDLISRGGCASTSRQTQSHWFGMTCSSASAPVSRVAWAASRSRYRLPVTELPGAYSPPMRPFRSRMGSNGRRRPV